MGRISAEERPAFEKLDQIRNKFAHRPDAKLDENDGRDLRNLLGAHQRTMLGEFGEHPLTPQQLVAAVALVLHSQLWMATRQLRDGRIQTDYSIRRLRATLDHTPHNSGMDAEEELRQILERSRSERDARGEP
jgi:hypothetical protein